MTLRFPAPAFVLGASVLGASVLGASVLGTSVLGTFVLGAAPAFAATVELTPGGTIDPTEPDAVYYYQQTVTAGGPQALVFDFVADVADTPFATQAVLGISQILDGMLIDPYLSWTDADGTAFASLAPSSDGGAETGFSALLTTLFSADILAKTLTFGWAGSIGETGGVAVTLLVAAPEASAVPIPATGLLLGGVLAGLGAFAVRRRT